MRGLLLAGVVVCAIATILSIISTASPYWAYQQTNEAASYMGLWEMCFKSLKYDIAICTDYNGSSVTWPDWLKGVQAMMLLGVLLLALSVLLGYLHIKFDSRRLFQASVLTTLLGGIVLIIAVIIFGAKEKDAKSDFNAGFYLALFGGLLAFVAAVLMGISKRGSTGYYTISDTK